MSSLRLVIGNKNYSSWSLRAWLTLKQADIPFEETLISLDTDTATEEKLRHAPTARVPVLHDGEITIWDSLAIVEYIAEQYPDRGLWPESKIARARARSLCAEMHAGFLDLRTELPLNCRARTARRKRPPEVEADIERILAAWRSTRAEFGEGGPFLFGEFTIADAFFAPVASRFFTYDVEIDENGRTYQETLFSLPPMQQWMVEAENEPMTLPHTDHYA